MDIGDYYSKSINGFTKNPLLAIPNFVGYVLMDVIVYGALFLGLFGIYGSDILGRNLTSTTTVPDLGTSLAFLGVMILVLIIIWIINSFVSAATIGMSKKIVFGEMPDLGDALNYGKKYLLKILAVSFIFAVLIGIALIPLILGVILLGIDPSGILGILGILIGGLISLILIIGVFLFFIFIFQSVIVGKKSITGSFKESYKLVKKNFFEVLVVLIINIVVMVVIGFVVGLISAFVGIIPILGFILGLVIGIIVNSIIYPYFTLVLTYLYMDLKEIIPEESGY